MAMPIASSCAGAPPCKAGLLCVGRVAWKGSAREGGGTGAAPVRARRAPRGGAWREDGDGGKQLVDLHIPPPVHDDDGGRLPPFLQQDDRLLTGLDACLNAAADMNLVQQTYSFLSSSGLIPSFGRYRDAAMDGSRTVTPTVLLELTGLEASKFSPRKWGFSGRSALLLVFSLALISVLLNNRIEVRPTLSVTLALVVADAIFLGGTAFVQVLSIWPAYRRRVLVHESGHILIAYLLGCPIRGVILDAIQAIKMGIQGQAGTQFWDETLMEEVEQGRLTTISLDRYCMILFAGIAAEALVYGQAEGGESDENLYKAIASTIRPPWTPAQMSNQARWAVLSSYKLLMKHKSSLEAVIESLEKGSSLAMIVKRIEASMLSPPATS